jgi:nucleoside-diphosphate-sugar epimerase
MMRVAVTGATGFVGSHVVRRLTASGHQVRILARRMPISALTPDKPLEVVLGDLDDQVALRRLVGGVDAVIHVAGIIKARRAAEFHKVNVEGTRHIAAALAEVSSDVRVIHVSSLAAREPGLSPYCASKRGGEDAIRALPNPVRLTIIRPPAVYGPGDAEIFPMFKAASLGFCTYPGTRLSRVSLIHGADLAAAIVAAVEAPPMLDPVYELDDGHAGG